MMMTGDTKTSPPPPSNDNLVITGPNKGTSPMNADALQAPPLSLEVKTNG